MKNLSKFILPVLLVVVISLIVWRHLNLTTEFIRTHKRTVNYTLKLAGENRTELEEVLEYFKDDSLKYEAACFLIANMVDHHGDLWQACKKGAIDSTFSLKSFKNKYDAKSFMDSLQITYRLKSSISDCAIMESSFLIDHINMAFELWQRKDNEYLSFDDFKESLLPYRVGSARLENSYKYATRKYDSIFAKLNQSDKLQAAIALNNVLKHEIKWNSKMTLFPGDLKCVEIDSLKVGQCEDLVNYGVKVFKAAGIAIRNDFVPAWGDNDAAHSWNVLVGKHGIIPFGACGDNPLEMPFYWRAPKIFRKTFKYQHKGIWEYKSKQQEVPIELSDRHHIDVTSQYFETVTINVPLKYKPKKRENCAFLCVYNRKRWHPVDWGKIDHNSKTACFSNINDSLLYCVMYYDWMQLKPATSPFWLASKDSLHFFEPQKEKIKLEKIFNYNYYRWNETEPAQEYRLLIWQKDSWDLVSEGISYPCKWVDKEWIRCKKDESADDDNIRCFIDFENVPSNGLYKLDSDERPFWIVEGKMVGPFPSNKRIIKYLRD